MNTGDVAKLLGVSISTIQRWVKQLKLPMEKNDRGHYIFNDEDIEQLKEIHQQIQQGVLLSDLAPAFEKKTRKGTIKESGNDYDQAIELMSSKIFEIETKLHTKADSVTSYQLLQHRREIEELQNQIKTLTNRITELENKSRPSADNGQTEAPDNTAQIRKTKKKNLVSTLFGF